jgi:hypothetical protein
LRNPWAQNDAQTRNHRNRGGHGSKKRRNLGTEISDENLLKMELGEKANHSLNEKEQTFTVLNSSLRKAREMSQSRGPLIFVKVDKGYFNADNE